MRWFRWLILSITDAAGNKTTFQPNADGRITQTTFPSTLSESYIYDAVGNLKIKTDRNGHSINYNYDFLNRLTQKSYPDTTAVNYTYDLANRLTQVADPTGTYTLSYDNMDRLTQTVTSYSFIPAQTFTVKYGYDLASNRKTMTDPQNTVTSYAYDNLNRLTTLTYPASTNYTFTYDSLGRRTNHPAQWRAHQLQIRFAVAVAQCAAPDHGHLHNDAGRSDVHLRPAPPQTRVQPLPRWTKLSLFHKHLRTRKAFHLRG